MFPRIFRVAASALIAFVLGGSTASSLVAAETGWLAAMLLCPSIMKAADDPVAAIKIEDGVPQLYVRGKRTPPLMFWVQTRFYGLENKGFLGSYSPRRHKPPSILSAFDAIIDQVRGKLALRGVWAI